MTFETFEALIAWNPPPTVQYIKGDILLEETKMCIFGPPKLFKSLLAQQLALCLATGTPWVGFDVKACKVAYLQSEVPKRMFQDRVKKMAQNVQIPLGSVYFMTDSGFKLDRKVNLDTLKVQLRQIRPKILILDPWYKLLSIEDNIHYSLTQDIMDALILEFGLSIVMIHHDTVPQYDHKAGHTVETFHPRGPRTVEGWFDSIIQIGGDIANDDRVLKFELRHGQYLPQPVNLNLDRNKLWLNKV